MRTNSTGKIVLPVWTFTIQICQRPKRWWEWFGTVYRRHLMQSTRFEICLYFQRLLLKGMRFTLYFNYFSPFHTGSTRKWYSVCVATINSYETEVLIWALWVERGFISSEKGKYSSLCHFAGDGNFVLTALALGNASKSAQQDLRQSLGGSFLIRFDYTENNPYLKIEDVEGGTLMYSTQQISPELVNKSGNWGNQGV